MNAPTLTILLAGLASRPWHKMAETLHNQAAKLGGAVEILLNIDGGQQPSGAKRHGLLQQARGNYVACIDDDDELHEQYLQLLLDACAADVDVITFNLEFVRRDAKPSAPTRRPAHALFRAPQREIWRFGLTGDNRKQGQMSANHLCAWRRSIAQRVAWCPVLGYADDQLWYKPLMAAGLVKTTQHIPQTLYRYLYDAATTCNQKTDRIQFSRNYVGVGLDCYWFGDEIMIEVGGGRNSPNADAVHVRDRHNCEATIPRKQLRRFHTIHIA